MHIEVIRFFTSSFFKYVLPERVCSFPVEYACFSEMAECIRIKYFCPFIAVISGSIAAAENMTKRGTYTCTIE